MSLGLRLRAERERLNFSQEAFAGLANSAKRSMIRWEQDQGAPGAAELVAWSGAGADVLYILTGRRADGGEARGLQQQLGQIVQDSQRGFVGKGEAAAEPIGKLTQPESMLIRIYRELRDGDRAVLERLAHALLALGR